MAPKEINKFIKKNSFVDIKFIQKNPLIMKRNTIANIILNQDNNFLKKNSVLNINFNELNNNIHNNNIISNAYEKLRIDEGINENEDEFKIEEDDGIFFKRKIEEILSMTKLENENEEKKKIKLLTKKTNQFKKDTKNNKLRIFKETRRLNKNKSLSKLSEDEFEFEYDFNDKAKSEQIQKLIKKKKKKKKQNQKNLIMKTS